MKKIDEKMIKGDANRERESEKDLGWMKRTSFKNHRYLIF